MMPLMLVISLIPLLPLPPLPPPIPCHTPIKHRPVASENIHTGADITAKIAAGPHGQEYGNHLEGGGGGDADDGDGDLVLRDQHDPQDQPAQTPQEDPQRAVRFVYPRK